MQQHDDLYGLLGWGWGALEEEQPHSGERSAWRCAGPPGSAAHGTMRSPAESAAPAEAEQLPFDLRELLAHERARHADRGVDLQAVVAIDREDAARGATVSVEVPDRKRCGDCGGSGDRTGTAPVRCGDCGGTGQQTIRRGSMELSATCRACAGEGSHRTPCPACHGTGQQQLMRTIEVRVPPHTPAGATLRVAGAGAPGARGGPPGDLVLELQIRGEPA